MWTNAWLCSLNTQQRCQSNYRSSLEVTPTTLAIFLLLWPWTLTLTFELGLDIDSVKHVAYLAQRSFSWNSIFRTKRQTYRTDCSSCITKGSDTVKTDVKSCVVGAMRSVVDVRIDQPRVWSAISWSKAAVQWVTRWLDNISGATVGPPWIKVAGGGEWLLTSGRSVDRRPGLSLIHIWRCRRSYACRSRWSPYH